MTMLQDYRDRINEIDEQVLNLFIERFAITEAVGQYKIEHGLAVLDKNREQDIYQKLAKKLATEKNATYIIDLWRALLKLSKQQQIVLMEEKENV